MGVLSFVFILLTAPLEITFITSAIYRPITSKWMDISYQCAFLNNMLNPILYLSLMRTGSGAVVSLFCGVTAPLPRNNSDRSVPLRMALRRTESVATSKISASLSCRSVLSPTVTSQSCEAELCAVVHVTENFNCNLCDYIAKNKTGLAKHRKMHKNWENGSTTSKDRKVVWQIGRECIDA